MHPRSTVPQPPSPGQCASPNRRLRRWLTGEIARWRTAIAAGARATRADRYRKHFRSWPHACLLLFHGLTASPSLRQTYAGFALCPFWVRLSDLGLGLDTDDLRVGFAQVAASSTSRPAAFLAPLVRALRGRARAVAPRAAFPPDLVLQDATFLRLSLTLAPWLGRAAPADQAGVKLQVQYDPARDLPEHVVVTDTAVPDVRGLEQSLLDDPDRLAALAGRTLVIDLGYYSHVRFAALRRAGVHFVTRAHAQAAITVTESLPIAAPLEGFPSGRITVHADERVTVGSPNNRAGAVLPNLRRVTATVAPARAAARQGRAPVTYILLTDRWDLAAAEVVQIYLWRWEIELFFRWLKSHLDLRHLLGHTRNAVELHVWLALATHLLLVLAAHVLGRSQRSPVVLQHLRVLVIALPATALDEPAAAAEQLPLPLGPPQARSA